MKETKITSSPIPATLEEDKLYEQIFTEVERGIAKEWDVGCITKNIIDLYVRPYIFASTPDPRDALIKQLGETLKELSNMYASTWDSVDGDLVMMGSTVPRFEAAHSNAYKTLTAYEQHMKGQGV